MNNTETTSYTLKVIVLDDDPVVLAMIGKMLAVDYEMQQAATYREFREKLLTFTPDVALIDLLLPDGDGIEICSELRKERSDGNLFIYILTANRDESSIEKAYRAGSNDYLIKPFNRMELKSKIAQCSRMLRSHDELTRSMKQQSRLKKRLFNLNRLVKNSIQVSDSANLLSEIEQILSVIPSRYLEVVTTSAADEIGTVLCRDNGKSEKTISFLKIFHSLSGKISRWQPSYLQLQPGNGETLHCAIMPYHVSGKTAGYILLERERKFSNDEKNILSLFGDFFGVMQEKINIHAQVEHQNARYRDEISKVRTVQVSLLPR
ncbi:MAG: response regulator, partial [Spirochaetota bacterium]